MANSITKNFVNTLAGILSLGGAATMVSASTNENSKQAFNAFAAATTMLAAGGTMFAAGNKKTQGNTVVYQPKG